MNGRRPCLALLLSLTALACQPPPTAVDDERDERGRSGEEEGEGEGEEEPVDIALALERAGVFSVEEITSENVGMRAFELRFQQPLDHDDPNGVTFLQRAVLIHRDVGRQFVLNPTGYDLFDGYEQLPEELTLILDANQLQVEHRFFANSHPAHDGGALRRIQEQVLTSDRFLFVYGGYDPCGVGANLADTRPTHTA